MLYCIFPSIIRFFFVSALLPPETDLWSKALQATTPMRARRPCNTHKRFASLLPPYTFTPLLIHSLSLSVMARSRIGPMVNMVNPEPDSKRRSRVSAQCQHPGCTTARTFGREGDKHASFCAIHKEEG